MIGDDCTVRFMADWGSGPIWVSCPDGTLETPDPGDLGLVGDLAVSISQWLEANTKMLNWDDPMGEPRASDLEFHFHDHWGQSLAQRLANFLGRQVEYRGPTRIVMKPGNP